MLESCLTLEPYFPELEDYSLFDTTEEAVYVLGKEFSSRNDFESLKNYVMSRLWFTYRKNFRPIGGTGPTSDQGWGCMLRCGQMMLGQALVVLHLGSDWLWNPKNKEDDYKTILRMFQDDKNALFSLHQIAQMGVSERKQVGEWFGPNTIAQVLKKLAVYDRWSKLAIHVAMDNLLIESDVRIVACSKLPLFDQATEVESTVKDEKVPHPPIFCGRSRIDERSDEPSVFSNGTNDVFQEEVWRPLLIIVPLRLGLTSINRCYLPAIKEFFRLPQCAGIIGGRPNHALYFIGMAEEEMIYLDPHICQPFVDLGSQRDTLDSNEETWLKQSVFEVFDDTTYHCSFLLHVPYSSMDPSLALGFICQSKTDYEQLNKCLKENLLKASEPPLFDILENRPFGFPEFVPYVGEVTKLQDYTELNDSIDSFDELEQLE